MMKKVNKFLIVILIIATMLYAFPFYLFAVNATDEVGEKEQVEMVEKAQAYNVQTIATQTISNGIYSIKSALNTNYVLDVEGASTEQCANILIYENNNANNQKFYINYLGNGYYTISAIHSNRLLDVANGGKTAGTNIWQIESNNTDAQKWIIKDAGNGYYNIISKLNGLYFFKRFKVCLKLKSLKSSLFI